MSQPTEPLPTPSEPTTPEVPMILTQDGQVIEPSQVPPEVLEALGRAMSAPPPPATVSAPPTWTRETQAAVRRITEIVNERCPNWAWAAWNFTPKPEQVAAALVDAGFKSYDAVGEDVAHDPEGKGIAQIQTINWDAHYTGDRMDDAGKARVVSDGRPENGGIDPIVTVGAPDAEIHGEHIAMMLESWERRYATLPETVSAPTPALAKANGSGPVSGVMAWACNICTTVVRQAPDGTMPTFVCPGCGATQNWRQPTIDELANVSPDERAAMKGAQPYGLGLPSPVLPQQQQQQPRQSDNDYYAGVQPAQGAMPDPETRAIADICWLLDQLPVDARTRVIRYVRDRWS